MTLIEINEELKELYKREKELLEMKSKIRLTKEEKADIEYNEFYDIANAINGFYFGDEKERKEIFEKKLMYIGQYARHKWLDMEHMIDLLDKVDHVLGKYKGIMIVPQARKLYLKIYPRIYKLGDDAIYDSEILSRKYIII